MRKIILILLLFAGFAFAQLVTTGKPWLRSATLPTIGGFESIYIPNQTNFIGSIFFGNGGRNLDNTGSSAGDYNTFAGINAGLGNMTSKWNTGFGYNALAACDSGWANTAVGKDALASGTGQFLAGNTYFYANTAMGSAAGTSLTTGSYNSIYGINALQNGTSAYGNTSIGTHSMDQATTAYSNVCVGGSAGYGITDGHGNTYVGIGSGYSSASGNNITAIGYNTLYNNTGAASLGIGYKSGYAQTTGSYNIFIGYEAGLASATGVQDTYIGIQAGYRNSSGGLNTLVGYHAGYGSGSVGNIYANTCIGNEAGANISATCYYNTFIGNQAGDNVTTGDYNISIGHTVDPPSATGNYQLNIGNVIVGDMTAASKEIRIDGSLNYGVEGQADDDYEVSLPGVTTLVVGLTVAFIANTANTDGATLEITEIGDIDALVCAEAASVATALATGEILAGQVVTAVFDGTNWQVTSRLANDRN